MLNAGMPACALPLLIFQKSAPSVCRRTSTVVSVGALDDPSPRSPWHEVQR